jgi:hypothetical protein
LTDLIDTDVELMRPRLVQPTPQLHEINWFWRRSWSFGVTLACLILLAFIVWALAYRNLVPDAAQPLSWVGLGLIALIAFVGLLYVAGATAYEFVQLGQAARVEVAGLKVEARE